MTTGDLLPVHLSPVWSPIDQADRHGHSTPPRFKVMSSNGSETPASGSCAPVRADQSFAYSRCSILPKAKNPGQLLELNTEFFELLELGHIQRHSTDLCTMMIAICRTSNHDNTSTLHLCRAVAESRTFRIYLGLVGGSRIRALALHEWNTRVNAALLHGFAYRKVGYATCTTAHCSALVPTVTTTGPTRDPQCFCFHTPPEHMPI